MRLVLAIISFSLAALLIGFGIAQRTVFAGPDHVTAAVSTTSSKATVSVIDGKTLNSFDRSQTVRLTDADTIFAAYGRTDDVLAWVGDASYNAITFDPATNELVSTLVSGSETEVPNPAGSDLWLADYTETKDLTFTVNVPDGISVLIVSDGVKPAPAAVSVTWLLDNSTPFAGPLVIAGAVMLLLGLGFLLWAVNTIRRSRGPRRRQPKLPKVPRKAVYKPVKKGAPQPAAITRGRRSAGMVAVPTILVGALLLSGCTEAVPSVQTDQALDTAATSTPAAELGTPAVTERQAKRIVTRVATAIAESDATNDPVLAATRLDGPALEYRAANYAIRKSVADYAAPAPIPASTVEITLPQRNDAWPRTVLAVVQGADAAVAPVTLVLIQDDPRSQYKVHYSITLQPGTVFPKVPPASIGTSRVGPDSPLLATKPAELAADYGDTLILDTDSAFYNLFQVDGDSLRASVGKAAQEAKKAPIPSTAQLTFANAPGSGQTVVMVTNDGGAIVAVQLTETETIKSIEAGAAVNAPTDVAALLGKNMSTTGITATYSDQLLFYVPKADTDGKIVLLGYSQGLISAAEL